jgi:hypothetical protein
MAPRQAPRPVEASTGYTYAVKYRGRKPTFDVEPLHRTGELLSMGMSPAAISAEAGIPRATVCRIKGDPAKAVALLETWGIA